MKKHFLLLLLAGATLAGTGVAFAREGVGVASTGRFGTGLFERSDKNQDGRVTAAEARAASLELFDALDRDGDSSVTRAEAAAGAVRWRAKRLEGRFVALDADRDGFLTEQEAGASRHKLERLDRDGDQRLTRSELQRAFSSDRRGAAGDRGATALSSRFLRWDLNRDERVTREEAVQATDRRFIRKDHNGDGVLTRPEPPLSPEGQSADARGR